MNSTQLTWHSTALVLLIACDGGSSGGANPDHTMNTGGAGAPATSGGDGGRMTSEGSGGMHPSTGESGSGGHATTEHGAGGARGSDAGSSSGTGGKASDEQDAGLEPSCPPECLRAYTCARSCGEPAMNNGCCPCPAGTIDTITCNNNTSGSCGLPCMGAKPDDAVVAKCQAFTDQASCSTWHGNGFPDHCEWHTPSTPPCLVP